MTSKMKAVIVEDETAAATNLRALLAQAFPDMEIIAMLESVAESVEWFRGNRAPDIVFMDIHLADGDAFRIFDRVDVKCPIVFTTAYDQYALEAFKVNSIDYLLKPIKESDLRHAVDKLNLLSGSELALYSQRVSDMAQKRNETHALLIHVKDRIVPLKPEDIAYCYTANEKVSATTYNKAVFPLDKSLEVLCTLLPEEDFFRANRQFIVARKAITDISVWFGNRLAVNLSVEVPERIIISKAKVSEFKKWISGIPK